MKELTIEQKAKAYDEAIEKAKEEYDKADGITKESLKKVFPQELKYADDEGIRKHLISLFDKFVTLGVAYECESADIKVDDILAWLEKQCEQKPVNIDYISGVRKELLGIEDNAKNINGLTESQWVAIRAAHRLLGECITKEQKLAEWSEEDEKKRSLLIRILEVNHPNGYFKVNPANTLNMEAMHVEELVDWLKSLRPQSTWKPSEEQMKALKDIFTRAGAFDDVLLSLINDLKKLMEE